MKKSIFYLNFILLLITAGCNKSKNYLLPVLMTAEISNTTDSTATVSGIIIENNYYTDIIARGVCWSTNPNPTINDQKEIINDRNNNKFSCTLTGLKSNFTYYVRAYATNKAGTGYGDQISFTTPLKFPVVSFTFDDNYTGQASILESKGVRGTIGFVTTWAMNFNEMHELERRGWEIASHSVTHSHAIESEYKDSRNFLIQKGFNVVGFITPFGAANNENDEWASKYYGWARDVVTYNEGYDFYDKLCNTAPIKTYHLYGASTKTHSLDTFKKIIDAAEKGKYMVIWMIHSGDISNNDLSLLIDYIQSKNIKILPVKDAVNLSALSPTLSTSDPFAVSDSSAKCGGVIINNNGAEITARGVCWSTDPNPAVENERTIDGSGTGIFTSYIKGLKPNTKYYLRAYATNISGTGYGNQISFTTLSD